MSVQPKVSSAAPAVPVLDGDRLSIVKATDQKVDFATQKIFQQPSGKMSHTIELIASCKTKLLGKASLIASTSKAQLLGFIQDMQNTASKKWHVRLAAIFHMGDLHRLNQLEKEVQKDIAANPYKNPLQNLSDKVCHHINPDFEDINDIEKQLKNSLAASKDNKMFCLCNDNGTFFLIHAEKTKKEIVLTRKELVATEAGFRVTPFNQDNDFQTKGHDIQNLLSVLRKNYEQQHFFVAKRDGDTSLQYKDVHGPKSELTAKQMQEISSLDMIKHYERGLELLKQSEEEQIPLTEAYKPDYRKPIESQQTTLFKTTSLSDAFKETYIKPEPLETRPRSEAVARPNPQAYKPIPQKPEARRQDEVPLLEKERVTLSRFVAPKLNAQQAENNLANALQQFPYDRVGILRQENNRLFFMTAQRNQGDGPTLDEREISFSNGMYKLGKITANAPDKILMAMRYTDVSFDGNLFALTGSSQEAEPKEPEGIFDRIKTILGGTTAPKQAPRQEPEDMPDIR